MSWLLWRQHRLQATIAAAGYAALAVTLWLSGVHMAHLYHAGLTTCRANDTCDQLSLFQGYGALIDLVNLTLVVPLLIGVFWAAPLLAREFEAGTHVLAWTQSVSRRRWFDAKLLTVLVAAALCSAAVTAVVTWWSGTLNSLDGTRFDPAKFEIQGVVPVAYTLFAVGLGLLAGALLRRSLPALGVTVVGYAAVRIAVDNYLRPHLFRPVTALTRLDQGGGAPPGSWQLRSTMLVNGQPANGAVRAPAQCVGLGSRPEMNKCVSDAGFRMLTQYQPAGRYWAFQWAESGIYLGLAAVLVLACVVVMRRREA